MQKTPMIWNGHYLNNKIYIFDKKFVDLIKPAYYLYILKSFKQKQIIKVPLNNCPIDNEAKIEALSSQDKNVITHITMLGLIKAINWPLLEVELKPIGWEPNVSL